MTAEPKFYVTSLEMGQAVIRIIGPTTTTTTLTTTTTTTTTNASDNQTAFCH
jgi:hypothetical protein